MDGLEQAEAGALNGLDILVLRRLFRLRGLGFRSLGFRV